MSKFTDDDIAMAVGYSHNYATARPDISLTTKEHVLGLCERLQSLLDERRAAWPNPPAQAAQVAASRLGAPAWPGQMEGEAPPEGWEYRSGYVTPTAEPVAQGEAVATVTLGSRPDCLGSRMSFTSLTDAGKSLPAGKYDLYIAQPRAVSDGCVLMPRALTAENGAKAALMGEFKVGARCRCTNCDGTGEDSEDHLCEQCEGSGDVDYTVYVDWTTIKAIYAAAVDLLAADQQPKESQG